MPGKTGGKKESENWIPTDARPFLFLFRIVLFLASQPLTDSSICRLLSQPVLLCQTACMANLRQYSRLQIGDSHAHSVETLKQTKHYGYYHVLKQKTFSVQIYVIIKKKSVHLSTRLSFIKFYKFYVVL